VNEMSQECLELIEKALLNLVRGLSTEASFKAAVRELGIRVEGCYQTYFRVLRALPQVKRLYPLLNRRKQIEEALKQDINPKLALPTWIKERLLPLLGEEGLNGLFTHYPWARVNELKISVEEIMLDLRERGVPFQQDPQFPFLLKLRDPPSTLPYVKEGTLIPQDRASVLAVSVLDPKPGETILEVGSSPGVKTSLIQQLTRNSSQVVAVDISKKRIELQKELMKKWSVENVHLVQGDGINFWVRRADKIFMDAPCSNSGTINVDPSIPLRLKRNDVVRLKILQARLLRRALELGIPTVYVTCSLFPEEGEFQVERYQDYLIPIRTGSPGYRRSKVWLRVARTFPHLDGSEGFFLAKLDFRKEGTIDPTPQLQGSRE
jgi:16S rRNA (cytosine967-C5)-methyltransferase